MADASRKPDAVYLPDGRRVGATRTWLREAALALPNIAKLLSRLATDDRVPRGSKRLAAFVGAYLISPIDVLPDFIPVIGKTDDLFLAAYALHQLIRRAGEPVVREHWDGDADLLDVLIDLVEGVAAAIPTSLHAALTGIQRFRVFRN